MSRTYTEAVSGAILARAPVWNIMWEVTLAKGETRLVTIDGFEFVLQADSRQTPTLNRGRVVSEDHVGRLYLPGWADPADPTAWTYIYVSTSLTQPSSEGLGAPKVVSRTEFDESVPHHYSKEGATGDAWLGNMHVLAIGDQSENVLISEFGRKGENSLMWLSLLMALITFLLSDDGTKEGRRKALLTAGAVGVGTAYVTSQTEWGQEINSDFNEMIGLDDTWTGFESGTDGSTSTPTTGATVPTTGGGGGVFSKVPPWVGAAGAGVAGAAIGSSLPSWAWWVGGGLLAYLVFIKE